MSALVRIRPASEADAGLWRLTRDVAALLAGLPWVLIGGQMVAIIEAEHGATIGRTTGDVDALLDVRAARNATLEAARRLHTAGFEPDRHAGGLTYRFIRGPDIVDVLAPDHVGERPDIRTVPPGHHFRGAGGSSSAQAAPHSPGRSGRRGLRDPHSLTCRPHRHQGTSHRSEPIRPAIGGRIEVCTLADHLPLS